VLGAVRQVLLCELAELLQCKFVDDYDDDNNNNL
jgi:hypothetical protein